MMGLEDLHGGAWWNKFIWLIGFGSQKRGYLIIFAFGILVGGAAAAPKLWGWITGKTVRESLMYWIPPPPKHSSWWCLLKWSCVQLNRI
jgi:hypothetical protein